MKTLKTVKLIGSSYNPSNGMRLPGANIAVVVVDGEEKELFMGAMSPKAIVEDLRSGGYDCSIIDEVM
jgi:hypothetical protein